MNGLILKLLWNRPLNRPSVLIDGSVNPEYACQSESAGKSASTLTEGSTLPGILTKRPGWLFPLGSSSAIGKARNARKASYNARSSLQRFEYED